MRCSAFQPVEPLFGDMASTGVLHVPYELRRHANVLSVAKDQDGCWGTLCTCDHERGCDPPRGLLTATSTYPRTERYAHLPDQQI